MNTFRSYFGSRLRLHGFEPSFSNLATSSPRPLPRLMSSSPRSSYSQACNDNFFLLDRIQKDLASMTTPVHTLTASDRCPAHLQQLSKTLLQMKVLITVGRDKMEMMALEHLREVKKKKRQYKTDKKRRMRAKTPSLADSGERGSGAAPAAGETPAPLPLPALDPSSDEPVPTPAPRRPLRLARKRKAQEEEQDNKEHDQ